MIANISVSMNSNSPIVAAVLSSGRVSPMAMICPIKIVLAKLSVVRNNRNSPKSEASPMSILYVKVVCFQMTANVSRLVGGGVLNALTCRKATKVIESNSG